MYDRRVDGRTLRFGHAGLLVGNSFVLYDHETDSLWVHVTGRAEHGPLKGKRLRFLPSTVTTWARWKQAHPHTLVLPGYRRGGFMGTYLGALQRRGLGLAVQVDFRATFYPFPLLARSPVVQDVLAGVPLVVFYDAEASTATAWRRELDGRLLDFLPASPSDAAGTAVYEDRETGSWWNSLTGEAVRGPLRGARLAQVSHHPIWVDRFRAFYPDAPVYGE